MVVQRAADVGTAREAAQGDASQRTALPFIMSRMKRAAISAFVDQPTGMKPKINPQVMVRSMPPEVPLFRSKRTATTVSTSGMAYMVESLRPGARAHEGGQRDSRRPPHDVLCGAPRTESLPGQKLSTRRQGIAAHRPSSRQGGPDRRASYRLKVPKWPVPSAGHVLAARDPAEHGALGSRAGRARPRRALHVPAVRRSPSRVSHRARFQSWKSSVRAVSMRRSLSSRLMTLAAAQAAP